MKNITIVVITLILTSCSIFDKSNLKSILIKNDSTVLYRKKIKGKMVLEQVPIKLNYIKPENFFYMSMKNSNYEIKDFKFRTKELKSAKLFFDTIFNKENNFESIETLILIYNKQRKKIIGINLRGNNSINRISESDGSIDDKPMPSRLYDILEFDEKGFLTKRYKENL